MDNLKKINDVHGHKAGDRALMTLGKLLARFASNGYAWNSIIDAERS